MFMEKERRRPGNSYRSLMHILAWTMLSVPLVFALLHLLQTITTRLA